jgi:peptidoglycan/LPS O-acetylase OafA/YrhL
MASTVSSAAGGVHTGLPLPSGLRQIEGLQVLRAIAVSLVAWAHSSLNFSLPGVRPTLDLGIFGIDLFFVISGFILSTIVLRSRERAGVHAASEFLKRRLIRIFPIYWVFAAITFLRVLHTHQTIKIQYLPSILLFPSAVYPGWWMLVPVAWTLVFEMFFYYVLSAVQLFTVKHAVPVVIAILCGAVAIGRFYSIRRPYLIVFANPILLEFVFGACIALIYFRLGKRRRIGIALTFAGVAAAIAVKLFFDTAATWMGMILTDDGVTHRAFTWGIAAALIVAGTVFWSPSSKRWAWRASVVVGDSSYSAYLASPLILEFTGRGLETLMRSHAPLSSATVMLCWLVMVAAVLAAGWLCYQLIEWPMLRKLQALLVPQKLVRGPSASGAPASSS